MEAAAVTPAVVANSGNPLLRAVFLRRLRLTRLLLEGGAYINESDALGRTPLMVACSTNHCDPQSASRVALIRFLLEKGADPNIQDKEGRSALMHACRERVGPEVVSLLVDGGADVSLEDQSGTSALVYAVRAADMRVLQVLLDTCKAKGKEVIIITTDKFPTGDLWAGPQPAVDPPETNTAPASPSEVQLFSSTQGDSTSLYPPQTLFSFKDGQDCRIGSHLCSPSRLRGLRHGAPSGLQLPLQRLNSEPWLKVPASLLAQQVPETASFRVPNLREEPSNNHCHGSHGDAGGGDEGEFLSVGLVSSHSASHPNLHSEVAGTDPGSGRGSLVTFHSLVQRAQTGADIYGSDPLLAAEAQHRHDNQTARDKLVPLRCSSTMGLGDKNKRAPPSFERRGSGTFLLDSGLQSRPRSLPPLTKSPALHATNKTGSGSSDKEHGLRGLLLPAAPPGPPRELSRRRLLRRHSIQAEQLKSTV